MTDNLKLWDQVSTTDPKHTRAVNQRGGFTAINAQYQMLTATHQWGPYGSKWGVKECNYYPIADNGKIILFALEAKFWYPEGEFEISVDTPAYIGKSGKLVEDHRKKLLTDLTTKALSKLGFSADIFLGLYDDNKYVQGLSEKIQKDEKRQRLIKFIKNAPNVKILQTVEEYATEYGGEILEMFVEKKQHLLDLQIKLDDQKQVA